MLIAQDTDCAEPATADPDNLIAFVQGANGHRADRRIEPGHIPATGENTDHALFRTHATCLLISMCVICFGKTPRPTLNTVAATQTLYPGVHFSSGFLKFRSLLS